MAWQGEWDERDPAKRIPSPLVPGLLRFFKGLICAALWTKLSSSYGPGACVLMERVAQAGTHGPACCSATMAWRLVDRQFSVQRSVAHWPCLSMSTVPKLHLFLMIHHHSLPPHPPPPDLLESRWFLHEAGLAHKLFLLWFVGLVARLKY